MKTEISHHVRTETFHYSAAKAVIMHLYLGGQRQPWWSYAEAAANNQNQPNTEQQTNAKVNDRLTRLEKPIQNLTQQLSKVTERMDQMLRTQSI